MSGALSGDDRIVHGRGQATGECQPPFLVGLLLIGVVPAGTGHADVVAAAGIEETRSAHTEAAGPGQRETGGADGVEAHHLRATTGDLHPPPMDVEEGMAGEEGELSAIGHAICPTTIRTRIVAPPGEGLQPRPEFPFPARPVVQAAGARKPGMADAEGVETGREALALRADHRLQKVAILRPFEAAGTGAEPQVEAAEVLGQSVRGIRQPFAAVESRIAEQAQRSRAFAHRDDIEGGNGRQGIQGRGERGGRSVPVGMPGRVLHRTVPAHRQPRHQLAGRHPVDGEIRLEECRDLLGVEARPVVDLAADGQTRIGPCPTVGHDDEVRGVEGELLGGSEIRP